MNSKTVRLTSLVILLAACAGLAAQDKTPKVLFKFENPAEKTTLVGFFYSGDEEEAVSVIPSGSHESVSIPFRKIKQMTLTKSEDRVSNVTVKRTDGSSVSGHIGPFNLLFIDPKKDRPYDLPLSDPTDYLADYGDRQSVRCALGTFTQQ